jgi:hypothetical protein
MRIAHGQPQWPVLSNAHCTPAVGQVPVQLPVVFTKQPCATGAQMHPPAAASATHCWAVLGQLPPQVRRPVGPQGTGAFFAGTQSFETRYFRCTRTPN